MARAITIPSTLRAARLHTPFNHLTQRFAAFWRVVSHDAPGPYRPERHYMRGPGPAWQAKNGQAPGQTPAA